jgi:uncharacterized protein involved in cysteine biosynthesis
MTMLMLSVVFRVLLWYCVWNTLSLFQFRYLSCVPDWCLFLGYFGVSIAVVSLSLVFRWYKQDHF